MTYFLYPGVKTEDVIRHLEKHGASLACINEAMEKLQTFYMKRLKTV